MPKSWKKPSKKGSGPVYDEASGTWLESNQQAVESMGAVNAGSSSPVLDLVGGQAQAAEPEKPGLLTSVMAALYGLGGSDDDKPPPEDPKRKQMRKELRKVEKKHAPWTDAFVAMRADPKAEPSRNAAGNEHASRVASLYGGAAAMVRSAETAEERRRRPGQDMAHEDPFFYLTGSLSKSVVEALQRAGLSETEIIAVTLYTSEAAYPMNAVLRGTIRDEATIRAYLPWCRILEKALAKLPPTVRNESHSGERLDPTKEPGAQVDLSTVYRSDGWTAPFTAYFYENMKVSRRLEEPGFLSTTRTRGMYGSGKVTRVIDARQGQGRSIVDLSQQKGEDEVLFPPRTAMRITSITDADTGQSVPDPAAVYSPEELAQHRFEVQTTIEGGPERKKREASGKEKDAVDKADASLIASVLAAGRKRLGRS